ncbi:hypothetical protein [Alkalibacillus haloalkaliphilus]|nr:hypothetical protein [Alkalibacillus haloalkaliphilus]
MEVYDDIIWMDINPRSIQEVLDGYNNGPFMDDESDIEIIENMNYVAVKSNVDRGQLSDYDKFAGTLSIMPYKDYYENSWKEINSSIIFTFINDEGEELYEYNLDTDNSPTEIEFELEESESMTVIARTDLSERIVAGILNPVLIKE